MKRFLLLTLIFSLLSMTALSASTTKYDDYAEQLKTINVFQGTGAGFELDRTPTRLEGLVMLIRLLGKEDEALSLPDKTKTIFTDVPEWGVKYVNFAYEQGLTTGIGNNKFGSNNPLDAKSYHTFLLRALNYDDKQWDFSWDSANAFMVDKNIISLNYYNEFNNTTFLRDHVAFSSYSALFAPLKGYPNTLLIDKLSNDGNIDKNAANALKEFHSPTTSTDEPIVVDGIEQVLTDDAYEMDDGRMSDYEFGLNKDASAGYWDGKSGVQEDIALFNDKIILSGLGYDFNENGYNIGVPLSFGRDDDGNPVIRIRGWRDKVSERDYSSVVANVNLTMELLRYYTGSEADTVLITNFIDDKAINKIDFGEGVYLFGNTKIEFTDPGVFGMDVHILK